MITGVKAVMSPKIVVVGSINMDLVVRSPRTPKPGENLFGSDFQLVPGGKGANQAVTAAKLGAESIMIARVGNDVFGDTLLSGLRECGVVTDCIAKSDGVSTGVALIVVNDEGENCIIVVSGANGALSPADVDTFDNVIGSADAVLLQFEIPMETVAHTIEVANRHNVPVVLDAGPARECSPELISKVTIISPNESETKALTGIEVVDLDAAKCAARWLLDTGAKIAVLKLGSKGALLAYGDTIKHIEGIKVPVVDTTAAGDVFSAALTLAFARGESLEDAVTYANYAGALAVTRFGAQTSTPTADELDKFIQSIKNQR